MPSSGMWRRVDLVRIDVLPKCRFLKDQFDAIYQKTAFFIVTAVKTSNPKFRWVALPFRLFCGHPDTR
jgi:hypothetical protein